MGIPVVYRKDAEAAVKSYDFIDAFENLGYVTYYGIAFSGAYILNRQAIASDIPKRSFTGLTSNAPVVLYDKSWDLDFNVPGSIAAAPLFSSLTIEDTQASNATMVFREDLIAYKVDAAGTSTKLASISGNHIAIGANATESHVMVTKLALPKTKIKKGEKLRVQTIALGFVGAGGTECQGQVWQDGAARGSTSYNDTDLAVKNATNLKVQIPFNLDL